VIEPINVKELITNTVGFLEPQRRFRDVKLRLDLDAKNGVIPGDPHQLQQVLVNLLLQAAERLSHVDSAGRTITVGLREHADGDSIEILVSDDGPRLPQALRERMFQVGSEGPHGNVRHFIVHSIVRNHRGAITVEALPLAGTLCSVRLPCLPQSGWAPLVGAR
jgi:signal transduction histidine kinase